MKVRFRYKGGKGSGNFGHAGRPGKVGGSSPTSGGGHGLPPIRAGGQFHQVGSLEEASAKARQRNEGSRERLFTKAEQKRFQEAGYDASGYKSWTKTSNNGRYVSITKEEYGEHSGQFRINYSNRADTVRGNWYSHSVQDAIKRGDKFIKTGRRIGA